MTGLAAAWNRFWFQPSPTSTLALFRIAFGVVVVAWTISVIPDAQTFFGDDGVLPDRELRGAEIGILNLVSSDAMVYAVVGALLLAGVAMIFGFHARVASVVVFIALLSLRRRNPWVMNSGDSLLRHISFFLVFAPTGAALSMDRWRRARSSFWSIPDRAPWALRLIQVQVSLVYLFTVWAKARSAEWVEGTAVFSSMRVGDLTRFDIPWILSESLVLGNLAAYATLAVELALAVLIWNRRARPWVIAAGVALHLFIEVTFSLGFFSTVMLLSYVAFIPEETASRWIARARDRWSLRRGRSDARQPTPAGGVDRA